MSLIGVSGKLGSGKNTVADMIRNCMPEFKWIEQRFAYPLKSMVSVLLGCAENKFEDQVFKNTEIDWLGTTPRYILQTLGTDWGRKLIHPDIWVKSLLKDYNPKTDRYPNWIITDARFPNEVKGIKELGGLVIRVERDTDNPNTHESETALDNYTDFDYVINNNGSLDDLKRSVQVMCEILKNKL